MDRRSVVAIGLIASVTTAAMLPAQEPIGGPPARFSQPPEAAPLSQVPAESPHASFDVQQAAQGHGSGSDSPTSGIAALAAAPPGGDQTTRPPTSYVPPLAEALTPDESPLQSVLKPGRSGAAEQPATLAPLPRAGGAPSTSESSSRRHLPPPVSSVPRGGAAKGAAPQTESRSRHDLAVAGRTPALRVDVAGPQSITVGKSESYVVNLTNESDAQAEEVVVQLSLPPSVTLRGAQSSAGQAAIQPATIDAARLIWNIPRLPARAHEQLRLQLSPGEGERFELSVDWTCNPASARASIAIRQPKLEMSLAGPAEMTYGEEKVFTLTVSNPGTGDAERVKVVVSSGDAPPQQIDVGSIPAGHKKEVGLQVVASQGGEIAVRANGTGEGGLAAEASGKIMVRKAEVNVAVDGPPLKFAGSETKYVVTIANRGTAAADNVNVSLTLPSGAKYLGGIEGATSSPQAGSLRWKIPTVAAGTERTYEVRLQLAATGLNRLIVQADAHAAGSATAHAETTVEAVSDLKLVVNDPAGPLPTSEDAVYEVQVTNRGSRAAQRVKILVQFSGGIEPTGFEGCEARIVPGQVVCQPLPELGAGEQVKLRIKAKAQQAGAHQFRVEVTTADGDARLVSEGTTRFFAESGRLGPAASTATRPTLVPGPAMPGTIQR